MKIKEKRLPKYEIKMMSLSKLKDNPRNPRTIEASALKGLASSIEKFGLIEPIIWNQRSGYIVGGHQRKKALELAGYKEAQVLVVNFQEEVELMANISLNNPKIQGEFTADAGIMIAEMMGSDLQTATDLMLPDLWQDLGTTEGNAADKKPEVPFTEELFEEHNYVVLTFTTKGDWLYLQTLFPLETVKALDSKPGFEKQGVGRVVDGLKFLKAIKGDE
jgi:hypothetical protein